MRVMVFNILLISAFLSLWQISAQAQSANSAALKLVIRVDDILSRNTAILPRSIVPLQDTVTSRGGKLTWGVMPHRFLENPNLDGVLANELKQTVVLGHEVSQHGFIHICQRCNRSSHEMYCTTFNTAFTSEEQAKLIDDGIKLFQEKLNLVPTSFIPPGHVYDSTTYQTLTTFGINVFSDNTEAKFLEKNIFNLPIQEEYTWALTEADFDNQLNKALNDIQAVGEVQGYYSIMMHDPFIRLGYNNGIVLRWIGTLLDSLNSRYGQDIEYMTLTDAANSLKEQYTFTALPNENTLVKSFTLLPNYPNPFNPSTTIAVQLQTAQQINLTVYSILGEVVAELAKGRFSAGMHTFTFNATSLPSGQYVARLSTGNGETATRKMILAK